MTAGKIYKKVYENIYLLNSLKAYEEAFSKVFLQEEFPQTLEQKENYRKYLDFILKEKALPKLSQITYTGEKILFQSTDIV